MIGNLSIDAAAAEDLEVVGKVVCHGVVGIFTGAAGFVKWLAGWKAGHTRGTSSRSSGNASLEGPQGGVVQLMDFQGKLFLSVHDR